MMLSSRGNSNVVPGAFHAALAIENGAIWITTDRGSRGFRALGGWLCLLG